MKQETTVFTHYDNPLKVESVREPESRLRLKIATQLLARYTYNTGGAICTTKVDAICDYGKTTSKMQLLIMC